MDLPAYVRGKDGGSVVDVFVQPRAPRDAVTGIQGRALKMKVTAPPVDDRANAAVEVLLARLLGIPKSRVEVVSGRSSRHKRVAVAGVPPEEVAVRLAGHLR